MVYRPKMSSNPGGSTSESPVQWPPLAATRDRSRPPRFPPWVENLLSIAAYNFPAGLVFFCVSCNKGRLFQERHFEAGADHHGHDRLRLYEYESSPCLKKADIESLGVNTAQIQEITWSVLQTADSPLFIFMHGTAGYADRENSAEPWKNCARASCRTRLHHVREWINYFFRFCSLDCKVRFFKDLEDHVRRNNQPGSPGPVSAVFNWPPPPPLPRLLRCDSYLSNMTFAQITKGCSSKFTQKSEGSQRTTNDALHEYMAFLSFHLDESDPPSVQLESPNAREADQIDFPEVLYKDQMHVLLSPSEDSILSYMRVCPTPPGSPRSPPEMRTISGHFQDFATNRDIFRTSPAAGIGPFANSNPVESPDPIGRGPECTLSDLTAASRLVRSAPHLKEWRTWSPGALGLTRKSLDDNIFIEESGFSSSFFLQRLRNLQVP